MHQKDLYKNTIKVNHCKYSKNSFVAFVLETLYKKFRLNIYILPNGRVIMWLILKNKRILAQKISNIVHKTQQQFFWILSVIFVC